MHGPGFTQPPLLRNHVVAIVEKHVALLLRTYEPYEASCLLAF
jgi:hypothetical protein